MKKVIDKHTEEFDNWYSGVVKSDKQCNILLTDPQYIHEPYGSSYGTSGQDKEEAVYYENLKHTR